VYTNMSKVGLCRISVKKVPQKETNRKSNCDVKETNRKNNCGVKDINPKSKCDVRKEKVREIYFGSREGSRQAQFTIVRGTLKESIPTHNIPFYIV
jgi:hypothetical protein